MAERTDPDFAARPSYAADAVRVAMYAYDMAQDEPVTAPAGFGVACCELRAILNISLPEAARLVADELARRNSLLAPSPSV